MSKWINLISKNVAKKNYFPFSESQLVGWNWVIKAFYFGTNYVTLMGLGSILHKARAEICELI